MADEAHPHCKSGCAGHRLESRAQAVEEENRFLRRQVSVLRQQLKDNILSVVKAELAKD